MNTDDIIKTATSLKQLEPGFLPYPIFEQIARLIALPILEVIPLRVSAGVVEVLLIARPDDDPFWPCMLHTPGTVIRATDINDDHNSNWPAYERIINDELKATKVGLPHYAGSQLHNSKRGVEQAQIYWVEVDGKPAVGEFYDVSKLPNSLIDYQLAFIGLAVANYKNQTAV